MYYPGVPILNPPHTPKNNKVESHTLLYMHSIIMPNRLQKAMWEGGRRHGTGAIPVVQRGTCTISLYAFGVSFTRKISITSLKGRWKFAIDTACLIDFMDEAQTVENWFGIGPCPQLCRR